MRNIKTNKVFFSVYREGREDYANEDNHNVIVDTLSRDNAHPISCKGSYKGKVEQSILLQSSDYSEFIKLLRKVKSIAQDFHQESILVVDNDNNATLVYLNGKEEHLGLFAEVASTHNLQGYTIIEDKIYTVL